MPEAYRAALGGNQSMQTVSPIKRSGADAADDGDEEDEVGAVDEMAQSL